MQLIQLNKNYDLPKVFVDFSHTPSSLNLAINAIRDHFHNRKIWCVFGCGGNRDRGKRRLMGKIAEENADYIVVTSDNPRNEDPDAIILSILEGITSDVQTIKDRSQAIEYAVMSADEKDIILIAGKGHENFQIIKNKTIEFSDQGISSEALKKKLSNIQND
jgi:UDP-N-acetylmuramoyl-L-alanyl-D-glutamate--2,6-diaminopimelate ligase